MSVLVTGASGLLGRAVVAEFNDTPVGLNTDENHQEFWKIIAVANKRAGKNHKKLDLTDLEAVRQMFEDYKPHAVVHCAAQRFPNIVEEDYKESQILNVDVSRNLAQLAANIGAAFLFISSDYVFRGNQPPYHEYDQPQPVNLYGSTKFQAEKEVSSVNPDSLILRIPVLYGGEEYLGESAVSALIKPLLNTKEQSKVSNFEIRYPSHTRDIAKICVQLITKKLSDSSIHSIFHWCGTESLTKFDMIRIIAKVMKVPYSHITPDETPGTGIERPKNVQLSCRRLAELDIGQHTPFKEGVKSFQKFFT